MLSSTRCWAGLNANKHPKGKQDKAVEYNILLRYGLELCITQLSYSFRLLFIFKVSLQGNFILTPLWWYVLLSAIFLQCSCFSLHLLIYILRVARVVFVCRFFFSFWKYLCSLCRAEHQLLIATESPEDRTERWRDWVFCCLPSVLSFRVVIKVFHTISLLRWLPKALHEIDVS